MSIVIEIRMKYEIFFGWMLDRLWWWWWCVCRLQTAAAFVMCLIMMHHPNFVPSPLSNSYAISHLLCRILFSYYYLYAIKAERYCLRNNFAFVSCPQCTAPPSAIGIVFNSFSDFCLHFSILRAAITLLKEILAIY